MIPVPETEPFDRRCHEAAEFVSGKPQLDEWLKRYAGQGERRDTSRTFVRVGQDEAVIGYYTLVVTEISRQQATEAVSA